MTCRTEKLGWFRPKGRQVAVTLAVAALFLTLGWPAGHWASAASLQLNWVEPSQMSYTIAPIPFRVTISSTDGNTYSPAKVEYSVEMQSGSSWTSLGNYVSHPSDQYAASFSPTSAGTFRVTAKAYLAEMDTAPSGISETRQFSYQTSGGQTVDVTSPTVTGVTATAPTGSSVSIFWTTNEVADSLVEYGLTSAYGSQKFDVAQIVAHSVFLDGLTAGSAYHYRVCSKDAAGNQGCSGDYAFTTVADVQMTNSVAWTAAPPTQATVGTALSLAVTITGQASKVDLLVRDTVIQTVNYPSSGAVTSFAWTPTAADGSTAGLANSVAAQAYFSSGTPTHAETAMATVTIYSPTEPNPVTVTLDPANPTAAAVGAATTLKASTTGSPPCVKVFVQPPGSAAAAAAVTAAGSAGAWSASLTPAASSVGTNYVYARAYSDAACSVQLAESGRALLTVTASQTNVSIALDTTNPTTANVGDSIRFRAKTSGSVSYVNLYLKPPDPQSRRLLTLSRDSADASGNTWSGSLTLVSANVGANDVWASVLGSNGTEMAQSSHQTLKVSAIAVEQPSLTVVMTLPPAGAQLSDLATFSATTSRQADRLVFLFDPPLPQAAQISAQGDANGLIWSRDWDSFQAANGNYQIKAQATAAGVTAVSAAIPVTVNNPVSTELPPLSASVKLIAPPTGQVSGTISLVAETSIWVDAVSFTLNRRVAAADYVPVVLRGNPDETHKRWAADWDTAADFDGTFDVTARAVSNDQRIGESAPSAFETSNGREIGSEPTANVASPEVTDQLPAETVIRPPVYVKLLELPSPARGLILVKAIVRGGTADQLKIVIKGPAGQSERQAGYLDQLGAWAALWKTTDAPDGDYELAAEAALPYGDVIRSDSAAVRVENSLPPEVQEPVITQVTVVPAAVARQSIQEVPTGTRLLQPVENRQAAPVQAQLADECVAAQVPAEKCQAWLARRYGSQECRAAGIRTREDCAAWLKLKFSDRLPGCDQPDSDACNAELARRTAGLMSTADLTQLNDAVAPLIGQVISFRRPVPSAGEAAAAPTASVTASGQTVSAAVADRVPLRPDQDLNLRVQASPEYAKNDAETSHQGLAAVLLIDSDGDGLPDDVERRLGTDPTKADTDGDGFSDYTEIVNGYNPLGSGKFGDSQIELEPVDQAIIAGAPLEQPVDSGQLDPGLTVDNAGTAATADGGPRASFSGRAQPGETVTIYLYSDLPIVLTTTAGTDGNWSYDLDTALADGEHQVYVALNDDTGKISTKSEPLSFFVASAQAVTEEEFFGTALAAGETPEQAAATASKKYSAQEAAKVEEPVTAMLKWYLVGAGALVLVAIIIGAMIFAKPRRPPGQGW